MTRIPKIAIVGRPNVGKSAIFNRICKKRIAIVDEAEGVTRDRLYATSDFFGQPFEIIDTGGIDPRSDAPFNAEVKQQAEIAIEEADALVMVVDSRTGPVALDIEVAQILRKSGKPICLAVNKIDNDEQEQLIHQFHLLGISDMIATSATHTKNMAEILEVALRDLEGVAKQVDPSTKLVIIGRPNVGKSTLINKLLDEQRCIVSPIAGTTRDSLDIAFEWRQEPYTLIDTAGIRRKASESEVVDKFAGIRTQNAIERADICLLIVDSQQGLTSQDKKIVAMIEKAGKGCILLFNKWDLVKGFRMEHCLKGVRDEAAFLNHCPKVFLSAKTGRNLEKIFDEVSNVRDAQNTRVSTHGLNKVVEEAMQKTHPPMIMGKRLRVYYTTQIDSRPPKFVMFINNPKLMSASYQRYLYNQLRREHPFPGLPLEFIIRGKGYNKARSK
ncbi:MAG: ribosome biogenesis GTPase Der [Chlamydiota bacterium]